MLKYKIAKALGADSLCEIEEGKYALLLPEKNGRVSLLYDINKPDLIEVYDPEYLLDGSTCNEGVYYVSLLDALRIIIDRLQV